MSNSSVIIVLEDSSKSSFGGGQKITYEFCKIFKESYRIVLFDTQKKTIFKTKVRDYVDTTKVLITSGKLTSFKYPLAFKIIESLCFFLFLGFNLYSIYSTIRREKSNNRKPLLYATTKKTLIYAFIISKLCSINYLFHAHSFLLIRPYSFLWYLYKSAIKVIAVSDFVKSGINLPNTLLVKNFVNFDTGVSPKSIQNKEKFIVASFGSLIPEKGFECLMTSYVFLPDELKNKVEFRIYGDGYYKGWLSKFAKDKIKLMGFCDNPAQVLKSEIDVIVIPSIILESFGMGVIEAFCFGIPVIASNQGGLAENVKNGFNGFLVQAGDPKLIAQKVSLLLSDEHLYSEYSKNALISVKEFDVSIFKRKMLNIIENSF